MMVDRFASISILFLLLSGFSSNCFAKSANYVLEIVVFHAKPKVSAHDVIYKADMVTPILKKMPGFVSREFGSTQQKNEWVDSVKWRSMQTANEAAKKTLDYPAMQRFMAIMQDYKMYHISIKATS